MGGRVARLLAEIWKVRAGRGDPELGSLLIGSRVFYGARPQRSRNEH